MNKSQRTIIIIIIVFVLFIIGNIFLIEYRGYHPDEAFRKLLSEESHESIWTFDTHPPLYVYFLKLSNLHLMRYVTLLLSIIGGLALISISTKLRISPLYTTLLYLTHVQIINYTGFALSTMVATVFVILAMRAYLHERKFQFMLYSVVGTGFNLIAAVPVFATFIYKLVRNKQFDNHLFLVGVICSFWFTGILFNSHYISWIRPPTIEMITASIVLSTGSIIALLFLLLSITLYYQKTDWYLFLNWIVPFIVLIITSYVFTPIFHDRYLIITIPFAVLLIAKLLSHQHPLARITILTFIIIGNTFFYGGLLEPSYTEVERANEHINGGIVLHHSMMSLHPSMIYSPQTYHYLDERNYTISAPLLPTHGYGDPDLWFDYELQQTGHESVVNGSRIEFDGLTLIITP